MKKIKLNTKKLEADANSEEIKKELEESILDADEKEVRATPTIFIGIKKLEGVPSYPEFKQMIIEQGGIEKQQ